MAFEGDLILSVFSYLFLLWFIFIVARQIFLCARNRKNDAKKLLYAALAFSFLAALGLTIYTVVYLQNDSAVVNILISFAGNFVLWSIPTIIAALTYAIYFLRKQKEPPKEETKSKAEALKEEKKNERMNHKIY
ncbi:hypothetical protein MmiEs2_05120 [Methanimicrococcus stummii]|uniref:Uncharacterized protein n=1 Tax=Methanimicrococcus stummii TaxID=3028294 RepID=A0AA96ZYP2_9EURY|nr:hypothetical protein [Methanimicrococcus sp. Es2]WNY28327.1 hypothetical protein MmiEs2_05120 [Methanimicrococcus sp. Es2]